MKKGRGVSSVDAEVSQDPRVQRTRRALRHALIELARHQPVARLSVASVTAAAGVSRPTFYDHYRDLDELTVDALRAELQELREISRDAGELVSVGEDLDRVAPGLLRLVTFLHDRRSLLARVLGPGGSLGFAAWLRETMAADVIEGVRARPDFAVAGVPAQLQADFIVGALLGALVPPLTASPPADPARLAHQTWQLLRRLFPGADPAADRSLEKEP